MTKAALLFFIFVYLNSSSFAKDYVQIDNNKSKSEKSLLLILPGLGSFQHGVKKIGKYYSNRGYDIVIPDYLSKKGIENSLDKLNSILDKYKVTEYSEVNVLCYIAGSWTFNRWLTSNKLDNLKSIVYDRSPLQERVPCALRKDLPFLSKLIIGNIIIDMCQLPYVEFENPNGIPVGLVIESRPTKLFMKHIESAMETGEIVWDPNVFGQTFKDYTYIELNHDDLYKEFDFAGQEILYFFKNKKFSINKLSEVPNLELNPKN